MSTDKLMRYWPLGIFVLAMAGSGITYYTGMQAIAAEVQNIKARIPFLAPLSIMNLRFTITENNANTLQREIDDNEQRATEQFEKVEKKLDKVIDLLLEQAQTPN